MDQSLIYNTLQRDLFSRICLQILEMLRVYVSPEDNIFVKGKNDQFIVKVEEWESMDIDG